MAGGHVGGNPLTSTAKPGGKKIKSAERDLRIDSGGHKGINPLTSTKLFVG